MKPVIFSFTGTRIPNRSASLFSIRFTALLFVSSLLFCPSALAFHLTLEWDPNIDEDLAGYIVYYGTASRNYKYDVDIGDRTSCTISGLVEGIQYFFAVTAYDEEGNESAFSRELTYPNISSGEVSAASSGSGGGCFVSSVAEGRWPATSLLIFLTVVLAGILALLIYRRVLT